MDTRILIKGSKHQSFVSYYSYFLDATNCKLRGTRKEKRLTGDLTRKQKYQGDNQHFAGLEKKSPNTLLVEVMATAEITANQ
jgi:hypothetical protein